MQNYLQNLLPRLKQFSQTLDRKEILIDHAWILTGDHAGKQQFIFRRDGRILQSVNGVVETGSWEYIAPAQSLLIQSKTVNLLFNLAFFDKGVLFLRKDGSQDVPWVLANQSVIPDLDVEKYLKKLLASKNQQGWMLLETGDELEYEEQFSMIRQGSLVKLNGETAPNGIYKAAENELYVAVLNSRVTDVYLKNTYSTDKGDIVIDEIPDRDPPLRAGMSVWAGDKPAPDGKYVFTNEDVVVKMKYIDVNGGVITKVKYQFNEASLALLVTIFILAVIFVISMINGSF